MTEEKITEEKITEEKINEEKLNAEKINEAGETSAGETANQPAPAADDIELQKLRLPLRGAKSTMMLWLLAGGYIFYLGVSLLRGIIDGSAESAGPLITVGAIAFLICGAFFVGYSIYAYFKVSAFEKEHLPKTEDPSKAEEVAEKEEAAASEKSPSVDSKERPRKLSISERANLVNRLDSGDDPEDEQ